MRQKRRRIITLGQLRERLSELLIEDDRPVMVIKNGIPLGFFLPAKVWKTQKVSPLSRQWVELVLAESGQSREDLQESIDDASARKKHPARLGALGC